MKLNFLFLHSLEIVKYIVSRLEDKNPATNNGWTPLHAAAQEGHFEVVKYISNQLDDKNPIDNDGDTPQSIAEENGNTEIVEYFKAQKRRRVVGSKKK